MELSVGMLCPALYSRDVGEHKSVAQAKGLCRKEEGKPGGALSLPPAEVVIDAFCLSHGGLRSSS